MRKFKLSVNRYRQKLEDTFGFADPAMVERYAEARAEYKRGKMDFNPFTEDPNCKSCKKQRKAKG